MSNGYVNTNGTCNHNEDYMFDNHINKMLNTIDKTNRLTDQNIKLIDKCIHSIEVFQDVLEGDILKLGDQMRKTFQEFPFKTIIPSYHQKILQEELRLNRML